jgi:hypothetical protein
MLVTSLLLGMLLLILTLALMARDSQRQGQVHQFSQSLQALELAEAGLEDARQKLDKDLHLPLRGDPSQIYLSYTDRLDVGNYTVTIDWSRRALPSGFIAIRSCGRFASSLRTLTMLLDVAPKRNEVSNPHYYHYTRPQDGASL